MYDVRPAEAVCVCGYRIVVGKNVACEKCPVFCVRPLIFIYMYVYLYRKYYHIKRNICYASWGCFLFAEFQ